MTFIELASSSLRDRIRERVHYVKIGCNLILINIHRFFVDGLERDSVNTYSQCLVLCNSLGYFIYDSVLNAYYNTLDVYITFHHMAAIWGLLAAWIDTYGASGTTLILFLSEITTPLYITKWRYERMTIPENSCEYQVLVMIYSFMFLVSRVIILQYFNYYFAVSIVFPTYLKLLLCINLYVFHILLTSLLRLIWSFFPGWHHYPEIIKNKGWWIAGKNLFGKYTKEAPWKHYYNSILIHIFLNSLFNLNNILCSLHLCGSHSFRHLCKAYSIKIKYFNQSLIMILSCWVESKNNQNWIYKTLT